MGSFYLRIRKGRRGSALVLLLPALIIICATGVLAVDAGYLMYRETVAQDATDAIARHAATGLTEGLADSHAAEVAEEWELAADQYTVVEGVWDESSASFVAWEDATPAQRNRTSAKSVLVTVRVSVPALFGSLFGGSASTVHATAVASAPHVGDPAENYGLLGTDGLKLVGNLEFDSYDGASTPGFTANRPAWGGGTGNFTAAASGAVQASSSVNYWGDLTLAAGGYLHASQGTFQSGAVKSTGDALHLPSVTAPAGAIDLGDLDVRNGVTTLPGGAYTISELDVKNTGRLEFTGPVQLYVSGDVNVAGHISTYSGAAQNLMVFLTGSGDVDIHGTEIDPFTGDIYGPTADVRLVGNMDFFGRIRAASVDIAGSGGFYADTSLTEPSTGVVLRQ